MNTQPCSPARPSGQDSTQLEPAAQAAEQLWSLQLKWHVLFAPQVQLPLAHSPSQCWLSPAQLTWHGPDWQSKLQLAPRAQVQLPLAQVPAQSESPLHVTWHGGLLQRKSQLESPPQVQLPLAHSALHDELFPAHSIEHGGAPHASWQCAPTSQ